MLQVKRPYQIATYYFPNYHRDSRNEARLGPGWTEWELLKRATPRFAGHQQPKVPLWGYEDEADPAVFARKIDVAANHGIDSFIFDWYYYDDGPFLQRALHEGYMGAANNQRVQFALMWANHDWVELFPARPQEAPLIYPGAVCAATFERMVEQIVTTYFAHPAYWCIDGCPYFSIYELHRFIAGLGGVAQAKDALAYFRERTRAAGFPDLHLNAVVWGVQLLPNEQALSDPASYLAWLNVQSVTSYVAIHHSASQHFPVTPYHEVALAMQRYWDNATATIPLPYFPNVTMGWDSSPRTRQDLPFTPAGYPYMAVLGENTPAAFAAALGEARAWLDAHPESQGILTINAWNEWTEGSYLEPDTTYGMAYLEAVRSVFGVALAPTEPVVPH
jgi:hypothetical protein